MATYSVPAETLKRFASVCSFFEPTTSAELKDLINTVRLENRNHFTYIISTNHQIATVERLGVTAEQDSVFHLKLTHDVLNYLEIETMMGGNLIITSIPELCVAFIEGSTGKFNKECALWMTDTPMNDWRSWAAPDAVQNNGVMCWDSYHVETLCKASPSGRVVFPQFIDAEKPVTIRDYKNKEWVGLFLPQTRVGEKPAEYAKLPEWW